MRLADSQGAADIRAELAAWLDEQAPPSLRAVEPPLSSGQVPDWARDWQRTLFDAGWLVPRWPSGLGGRRAGPVEHLVCLEEMSRRQVPRSLNPQGLDVCAPVLVEHGTDEQRERWALPTLRGEMTWCLAVREEDLPPNGAAVTSAFAVDERDGELVVSGSQPAPPGAQHADACLCAARIAHGGGSGTGEAAVLVVDLRSPGVVRPLRPDLTDPRHDPDELIFDDVAVEPGAVIGPANGGGVAEAARAHERSARWITRLLDARRAIEALVVTGHARGLTHDPVFRDSVAALRVDADGARALAYRAFAKEASGRPAPEVAMLPLLAQELSERVYRAGAEALGGDGLDLGLDGPFPGPGGAWPLQWLTALAESAAVSRPAEHDRVAARVLGLQAT